MPEIDDAIVLGYMLKVESLKLKARVHVKVVRSVRFGRMEQTSAVEEEEESGFFSLLNFKVVFVVCVLSL